MLRIIRFAHNSSLEKIFGFASYFFAVMKEVSFEGGRRRWRQWRRQGAKESSFITASLWKEYKIIH